MAESTQKLSQTLKNKYPEIPWKDIAGFRNVLVHDYLGLNLDRIWRIVEQDLPNLKRGIKKALKISDNFQVKG